MGSVLTSFSANDGTRLTVTHGRCDRVVPQGPDAISLRAERCEPNMLTRIRVDGRDFERHIFVHWHHRAASPPFGMLLAPGGDILFVGGGTLSASIALREAEVLHSNEVEHFWGFQRRRDTILEIGERECRVYDLRGHLSGCVPVDPPYEIREGDGGLEFHSDETEIERLAWA